VVTHASTVRGVTSGKEALRPVAQAATSIAVSVSGAVKDARSGVIYPLNVVASTR
jgi:hypothetical protein